MTKCLDENSIETGEYRGLGAPISELQAGLRADAFLASNFPFLSRNAWQKRLESGQVLVDQKTVGASYRLKFGEKLALLYPQTSEPDVDRGIYPIWRKGAVMAVFKPAPLPMHENGPYRKNTFAEILHQELGKEWSAVHRLDRETSGIVLCGATSQARQLLSRSLAARSLFKEYLAIVKGTPLLENWIDRGPIGDLESSEIRIKKWVVASGQAAETHFNVLERSLNHTLLSASPKTGRTNQIRIHAAHAGYPLVGDRLFHPDEKVFLEWFVNGLTDFVIRETGHRRCLLHARAIAFEHPEDNKVYEVECAMPEDMREVWSQLKS